MLNSIQSTGNYKQNYRPNFGMAIDQEILQDFVNVYKGDIKKLREIFHLKKIAAENGDVHVRLNANKTRMGLYAEGKEPLLDYAYKDHAINDIGYLVTEANRFNDPEYLAKAILDVRA